MRSLSRRIGGLITLLGAGIGLAALVVGVPLALSLGIGFPHSLPSWSDVVMQLQTQGLPTAVLLYGLAFVCWVLWLYLMWSLVAETIAAARRSTARRRPVARPGQRVAALLIASLILGMHLLLSRPATTRPTPSLAASLVPRTVAAAPFSPAGVKPSPVAKELSSQVVASSPSSAPATDQEVTVVPGDTLWGIAGEEYHNPTEWPRIWEANQDRSEPDGRVFTDPHWIYPGEELDVPGPVVASPEAPVASPPTAVTTPSPTVVSPAPSPLATPPPTSMSLPPSPPPTAATAPAAVAVPPTVAPGGAGGATTPTTDGRGTEETTTAVDWGVALAEGGTIGLGVAAAAVAGLWLMRRHERRRWRLSSLASTGRSAAEVLLRTPSTVLMRRALTLVAGQRGAGALPTAEQLQAAIERVQQMPGRIPVGQSRGDDVVLDVSQLSGLCLTGPGAEAAARAMALSVLAYHGPAILAEVVTTSGWGLVPGLERIRGVYLEQDLAAILQRIQGEFIRRERTLAALHVEDFAASAATDDPLPAVLVPLSSEALQPAARLAELGALLDQGRRLGVAVLVVGASPSGGFREVVVAADGSLAPEAAALMGGARWLYAPSASEAAVVAASLAGREGEEVDVTEFTSTEELAPEPEALAEAEEELTPSSAQEPARPAEPPKPVQLSIFGGLRIFVGGEEVEAGIGDAGREVLSLLAVVKRGELNKEQGIDLISGGVVRDFDYGTYFENGVRKTRLQLRQLTGLGTAVDFIPRGDLGYRLNRDLIDTDLWRLEAGIAAAQRTDDLEERRWLLQGATRGIRGIPLAGAGEQGHRTRGGDVPAYEWLIEEQPRLQQRAMATLSRLAELHAEAGDVNAALQAVEQAMTLVDGPNEDLYRQRIEVEHRFGRDRAAMATYGELCHQLAWDMPDGTGDGPDEETTALMDEVRAALYGPRVVAR
jgi:DNA-binding SARP family transcriptional activator